VFKPESRGRQLHRPEKLIISASTATGKRSDIDSVISYSPEPFEPGCAGVRLSTSGFFFGFWWDAMRSSGSIRSPGFFLEDVFMTKPISFKPVMKCAQTNSHRVGRPFIEEADHRQRRLLRLRGQRPCCCGTAEKLDEFAARGLSPGREPSKV
jgi:hypothetical protein